MTHPSDVVRIAPWKDDRQFAYSITYDEGLIETAGFAWRLHRRYGIPGHVNAFPTMLGKLVGDTSAGFLQSLWNLQKYAEAEQLRFLIEEGWTIGCQFSANENENEQASPDTSWTAGILPAPLFQARQSLEKAIARPVHTLAFTDFHACETHRDLARQAGFRWLFTLHDDLNDPDEASHVIKRSPLYHCGPAPIRLANDPYRLLARARDQNGWVVDVVRLVDRFPIDPARDCTPTELEARFAAVQKIGGDRVWAATPETVAGYRALRLSTQIQNCVSTPDQISYHLAVSVPVDVSAPGELTFLVHLDDTWQSPRAIVAGETVPLQPGPDSGSWLFTHPVVDGMEVKIEHGSRRSA